MADEPAGAPIDRLVAPDGSLLVELESVEWFNTHWVRSPRITEITTGRVLLDLWGTDWDAEVGFPRGQIVTLGLRRYRSGGWLDAEIDLAEERYTIDEGADGTSHGPLAELSSALEAASQRVAAAAPPRPEIPPTRPSSRSIVFALLILVGALIAIAAATFVIEHLKPQPVHKLDRVPPMPPASRPSG